MRISWLTMFRSITIATVARPIASASRLNSGKAVGQQVRGYHEKVISHYERPRNASLELQSRLFGLSDNSFLLIICCSFLQVGSLPKADVDVGTGLVGAPA